MISGNLLVKPLSAKLTHDTKLVGTMNPYLKVIVGNQFHSTTPAMEQHLNPSWNNVELPYRINNSEIINFEVWNKGTLKDEFIGSASVASFSAFSTAKTFCEWIPLRYNENSAGSLLLEMQFFQDNLSSSTCQVSGKTVSTALPSLQPQIQPQIQLHPCAGEKYE